MKRTFTVTEFTCDRCGNQESLRELDSLVLPKNFIEIQLKGNIAVWLTGKLPLGRSLYFCSTRCMVKYLKSTIGDIVTFGDGE